MKRWVGSALQFVDRTTLNAGAGANLEWSLATGRPETLLIGSLRSSNESSNGPHPQRGLLNALHEAAVRGVVSAPRVSRR